jgi:hypothetical protein
MKRIAAALIAAAATLALGACAHHGGMHGEGMRHGGTHGGGSSAIYWCGGATDGVCSGISTTQGTCPDGKPMNAGHVVWVEGTTALVCTCDAGCACAIDPNDHTKCACGKPVRRIDLAGTGIYFCNCKGSCGCNTISDKPGACGCGMPLKQAK